MLGIRLLGHACVGRARISGCNAVGQDAWCLCPPAAGQWCVGKQDSSCHLLDCEGWWLLSAWGLSVVNAAPGKGVDVLQMAEEAHMCISTALLVKVGSGVLVPSEVFGMFVSGCVGH